MLYKFFIIVLMITAVSCSDDKGIGAEADAEANTGSSSGKEAESTGEGKGKTEPGGDENASKDQLNTVTLTDAQIRNGGIEIALPASENLKSSLTVNGSLDVPPQNIISVSFPFGGYLKSSKLIPGMSLRKGEVIGVMEDQGLVQLQQDYLMAHAKLRYLQQDFERQKTLQENNVNSAKAMQMAEAEYNGQKALVSGYAQKLAMININPATLTDSKISRSVPIYSPITGFVSAVNVNIGKFVNPSDVLFELINPQDLHVALVVFEKDMSKVRIGQKVLVSLVNEPGHEYACEVILVTRNVNQDRTGVVHCHFTSAPKSLLPGMFLNGKIMLSETAATTVPEDAVVRVGNEEYILQEQQKNSFRLVAVETGIRDAGKVQLIDSVGRLTGKPIVSKNAYTVLSKMKNTE